MIKADKGHYIKAYLIDINPFCRGGVRRVLIDEYGGVFYPTYGWCHNQDSYHIIPLPKQVKRDTNMRIYGHLDPYWWERKAWDNELWAWTHMQRGKLPNYQPCYVFKMYFD